MSTCFYRIRYRNSVCKIVINKYKCRVISVFIVNNLVISNTYTGYGEYGFFYYSKKKLSIFKNV